MFKKEKALFFLTAALTIFPFLPWVPLRTAQRPVRTDTAQPVDFDTLRQMSDICQCFYTGWVNIGDKTLYFTGGMPADGVVATEDSFMRFQHGEPNPGWEDGMMFFDDNGRAVTGLYEIEGTVFLFDDNGQENWKGRRTYLSWRVGGGVDLFHHLRLTAAYGFGITKAMTYIGNDVKADKAHGKDRYWMLNAAWLF